MSRLPGFDSETIRSIIDRDVDWRAVRDCGERAENARRLTRYHDRLALSADPLADPDVVTRRQIVGLRVIAEMRRRDRMLRLWRRVRAPRGAQTPAATAPMGTPTLPDNVVRITGGWRT